MSVNFDPVSSNTRKSLVNSSSSLASAPASAPKLSSPSLTESSKIYKLIAFQSNSASSLSVNSQDNNKNLHQHNDLQKCLDKNLMVKHCLSESPSPSSSTASSSSSLSSPSSSSSSSFPSSTSSPKTTHYDMTNEFRKSSDNHRYSKLQGLDREWYSARKSQLDEILVKLQQLHKLNLDDRENIEGMKKKTIKLIATYSNITMKTNNFLTRWDRKYGSKLKNYQTSSSSLPLSSSPCSFSSSPDPYSDKHETDFLFNTSRIW